MGIRSPRGGTLSKKMKRALIIGVADQDGAYLAEFLLKKGYEAHGVKRCSLHSIQIVSTTQGIFRPLI